MASSSRSSEQELAIPSSSKRPRACDPCHAIKIKCELGTTGGSGPCSRCNRLGKECIITPPKRQKDRVAELEAQVRALTELLEAQKIQVVNGFAADNGYAGHENDNPKSIKKRKLSNDIDDEAVALENEPQNPNSIEVDTVVSSNVQRLLLGKYLEELLPQFPLCPIPGDCDYETMRKSRPVLLQAIVYAASPGLVSTDEQEALGNIIMSLFATQAIGGGIKSIELVLAMQIVVMHYRAPGLHTHISAFQLVEIMTSIAQTLAAGELNRPPSSCKSKMDEDISITDVRRAWNVCQLFSEAMAIYIRRPCPYHWDHNVANGLYLLEYAYALPTDRLLCQYIRAEALCGTIASRSDYYTTAVQDMSDPETQATIQALQDQITDWKAQIPPGIWCNGLAFYDHIMMMYLYEPVLHTSTNKQSFSAPFIAEKLSVTDFPKPFVTQEHLASITALTAASHAVIDLYTSLDVQTAMALPAVQFAARVLYALYILVKIHIASTANSNTFGPFIDTDTLKIDSCIDKMSISAKMIGEVDDRCGQYRILQAVTRMREWLTTFRSWSFQRHSVRDMNNHDIGLPPPDIVADGADWEKYLADEVMGVELDELFPELQPSAWFTEPFELLICTNPLESLITNDDWPRGVNCTIASRRDGHMQHLAEAQREVAEAQAMVMWRIP